MQRDRDQYIEAALELGLRGEQAAERAGQSQRAAELELDHRAGDRALIGKGCRDAVGPGRGPEQELVGLAAAAERQRSIVTQEPSAAEAQGWKERGPQPRTSTTPM